MIYKFKLPDLGEGITESEIVAWDVKVGDVVKVDDPLFEVQNDKTTIEVPSPVAGEVKALLVEEHEVAKVGQVLLEIEVEGAVPADKAQKAPEPEAKPETPAAVVPVAKQEKPAQKAKAIPSVRKYARERM
ncbi:biotin/lipoyl-containing protein [Erysipelothrix inopinata]|uniref:biotin/lipoyl-containing protein n=1 Tax=Erysipelothrix inopinata TaxID=225084 RepID=UPI001FEA5441|nr:biotin/lipoyl-containing protein [Erysipelothrix inopinata]